MTSVDPRLMANAIRFLSMDAIERAGEGHPGTPLGAADITTALFTRHLKFNAADPLWFDRDRFVQSNGHGSMLLYSLLHLTGYERRSAWMRSSASASSTPTAPGIRNTTLPQASRSRPACSARASPTPPAWLWPKPS
jgi:transketolase